MDADVVEENEEVDAGPPPEMPGAYDPDLIPGIVTGDDMIEFYGKYGQDRCVQYRARNGVAHEQQYSPGDQIGEGRRRQCQSSWDAC